MLKALLAVVCRSRISCSSRKLLGTWKSCLFLNKWTGRSGGLLCLSGLTSFWIDWDRLYNSVHANPLNWLTLGFSRYRVMYKCKCGLRWVSQRSKTTERDLIPCLCGRTIITWDGTFVYGTTMSLRNLATSLRRFAYLQSRCKN